MPFVVLLPKKVEKQIAKLPAGIIVQIIRELKQLEENPFAQNSKKLKERNGYRVRVGDYRIIYEVNLETHEIMVLRAAHRKDIYK